MFAMMKAQNSSKCSSEYWIGDGITEWVCGTCQMAQEHSDLQLKIKGNSSYFILYIKIQAPCNIFNGL